MNILELNARDLRNGLVNKEYTCKDIIEEYFKNIDTDLNAYIDMDKEKALEEAGRIDEKIAKGEDVGLLAGLPISVKDNIMTKKYKTTAGSKMLENFYSPYDASVIEKIKSEDGIIIGKTNMDEFAMGSSGKTSYFGQSRNPVDKDRTPGGSSGGSAVSIKAKEAVLSLGSDTGGSVRQPASYCGVVGLKPSYGRVSRYGLIAQSNTMDTVGIIARDVLDSAYMLNIISGKDEKDFNTLESENINISNLEKSSVEGLRIAVPKEFAIADTDRNLQTEFSKTIKYFKDMGCVVEEVEIPSLRYAEETFTILNSGDLSSNMARYDGIRYGYRADEYESLEELYMNSRSEGLGEEVKKRIIFGTYLLSGGRGREYYDKALLVRRKIINEFDKVFEDYDVVLGLSSSMMAGKLNEEDNESLKSSENLFLMPANLAGLCAISVPAKVEGLPIGIQLIGDRFKEENILKAALAYERMVK